MTEAEAWLIVAEEFRAGRTSRYLCFAVGNDGSSYNRRIAGIPREIRHHMRRHIKRQLGGNIFAYESSYNDDCQKARLTALCLFAAMAKDGATA